MQKAGIQRGRTILKITLMKHGRFNLEAQNQAIAKLMLSESVWRGWKSRCLNGHQGQELQDITSGDWMLVITKSVGIHMMDFPSTGTTKIARTMRVNWRWALGRQFLNSETMIQIGSWLTHLLTARTEVHHNWAASSVHRLEAPSKAKDKNKKK